MLSTARFKDRQVTHCSLHHYLPSPFLRHLKSFISHHTLVATVGLPSSGLAVDQQTPHEGCVGCMTLLVCSSSDPLVVVGVVGEVGEEHGPGQLHLLCGPGGSNHLKRGQAFYKKWLGEELPFFNEGY